MVRGLMSARRIAVLRPGDRDRFPLLGVDLSSFPNQGEGLRGEVVAEEKTGTSQIFDDWAGGKATGTRRRFVGQAVPRCELIL